MPKTISDQMLLGSNQLVVGRERSAVSERQSQRGCYLDFINGSPRLQYSLLTKLRKSNERPLMPNLNSVLAALVCAAAAIAATPASAITCEGNFQVQPNGARIATPYCEDGMLGRVAREHGASVSDHELRWNPSEKQRICRFVGDDNRVRETCQNYMYDNDSDDWR
jgi:hypothetical protein